MASLCGIKFNMNNEQFALAVLSVLACCMVCVISFSISVVIEMVRHKKRLAKEKLLKEKQDMEIINE